MGSYWGVVGDALGCDGPHQLARFDVHPPNVNNIGVGVIRDGVRPYEKETDVNDQRV